MTDLCTGRREDMSNQSLRQKAATPSSSPGSPTDSNKPHDLQHPRHPSEQHKKEYHHLPPMSGLPEYLLPAYLRLLTRGPGLRMTQY